MPALATEGAKRGTCLFTPYTCAQTSLSAEKTRQAACTPHRERIWPAKVAWRQPATLRRACEAAAAPQTPHWSPKKHFRASQGARAAQDATDAAPGTLTRRRQPALAQGCSSPRVGARSTPRRAAREHGRASPGQSLGGAAPVARTRRRQPPRRRGPPPDRLDCACLRAARALVRRGAAGRHTSTCSTCSLTTKSSN